MLNRRDAMVRLGQVGLGSLTLPNLLKAEQSKLATPSPLAVRSKGRAKACILVYLWGGPPQQDMWDLKPDSPTGVRSLFHPIPTVVPGIDVSDQMPLFAKHTDKVAILRSLTHGSNVHEASVYHTLTGQINPRLVSPANFRRRTDFPNLGSIVSYFTPPQGMPASVTVPRPIGHDGVTYSGTYGGFLGSQHDPMELLSAPMANDGPTHSMKLPPELADARFVARRGLLNTLEEAQRALDGNRATLGYGQYSEKAFGMLTSPVAKQAFDLEQERPETREKYGKNEYGESFLLARRLVESGVRLITITWMWFPKGGRVQNVWDNHDSTARLQSPQNLPPLDQGFAALMIDLSERGLLDETLVGMWGEFGRTPKLNGTTGRDHWGMCQSAVLAGGGIRGGQVYGSSDSEAAYPKTNAFSPEDLLATVYEAMGLSPDLEIHDREGRPHRISTGMPLTSLFV